MRLRVLDDGVVPTLYPGPFLSYQPFLWLLLLSLVFFCTTFPASSLPLSTLLSLREGQGVTMYPHPWPSMKQPQHQECPAESAEEPVLRRWALTFPVSQDAVLTFFRHTRGQQCRSSSVSPESPDKHMASSFFQEEGNIQHDISYKVRVFIFWDSVPGSGQSLDVCQVFPLDWRQEVLPL